MVEVKFQVGDAHALDFGDRSFDAVVCLRMLMHVPNWERCLAELCRTADRLVIVDYPSAVSVALFESMGAAMAHRFGGRAEPYRSSPPRPSPPPSIATGSASVRFHRQFVLPIAFHKAIVSRRFHHADRERPRPPRLLKIFGSPVTPRRRTVNVLVTGATGFTGGHLARGLAARGPSGVGAGA